MDLRDLRAGSWRVAASFNGFKGLQIKEDVSVESVGSESDIQALIKKLEFLERELADHKDQKKTERRQYFLFVCLMIVTVFLFVVVAWANPTIGDLEPDTISTLNKAVNVVIVLFVPFVFGVLGAAARVLIAGISTGQQLGLIVSSGFMAVFSWIGIKSGVLIAVIAPHLEKQAITSDQILQAPGNFYTLALVAIFVGMFSSNLYIFINQKVEQLTIRRNSQGAGGSR